MMLVKLPARAKTLSRSLCLEKNTGLYRYLFNTVWLASGISFIGNEPVGEPWSSSCVCRFVYSTCFECGKKRVSENAGDWEVL